VRRHWKDQDETTFGIYEVFYDDQGRAWAVTENPVEVSGDSVDDLAKTLKWMKAALSKKVLDYDKIPEKGANKLDDA